MSCADDGEHDCVGRLVALIGRHAERGVLDRLLADVRAGESRSLVLLGEAGVGKTALLDYLATQATDCRVARAAGVQSEMELPFATLHQLCAPLMGGLQQLPAAQGDALQTAFGISSGSVPDRLLISLATLSLLSGIAERQPLVCLIDDQQWVDRASAQVFGFVARRLMADSVALVFAARVPGDELAGLAELGVEGLGASDGRALLDIALTAPLDARIRDQIVAETRGNPLALLELPRGLTPQQLAGGFGLPGPVYRAGGIEESFRRRVDALPGQTRQLLLAAAAEPRGDPSLLWLAASRLGIDGQVAVPAVEAGLVEIGSRVRFRHPLVRSVVYESASAQDRQAVHAALAEVTDPQHDPDRRAWHRAQAAPGPDEEVATELERSADRARARGGWAAAAAFLERATTLTLDTSRRADRALNAASAKIKAGAVDAAREMLAIAEDGPLSDFQQARADLAEAELAFVTSRGGDAPCLLVKAAKRLELIDPDLSRSTYLQALCSAMFAGRLSSGGSVWEVARVVEAAPPPTRGGRAIDLLLDGLVAHYTTGYATGLPMLRKALDSFGSGMSVDEELRWHSVVGIAAQHIWHDGHWEVLSVRHVQLARDVGALSDLPMALNVRAFMLLFAGDLPEVASLVQELEAAMEATGIYFAPYAAMALEAMRGREAETYALVDATIKDVSLRGEGNGIAVAQWATAVLSNGLGEYSKAITAAERATEYPGEVISPTWASVELVEAAARTGRSDLAVEALRRLTEVTTASGTDWALGIEARSRALLSDGDAAEHLYCESIERLGRTRIRADLARAHLLYGEWLRRQRRRVDAREQLRIAYNTLAAMGMAAFAERARRELQATGEKARKRTVTAADQMLTAQEAQIARMARDGLSNPEIGARLFISPRTVKYHLSKVFAKLNIDSRSQLKFGLADS
jgi:DNA-binding CsgD family transcriptional regulator